MAERTGKFINQEVKYCANVSGTFSKVKNYFTPSLFRINCSFFRNTCIQFEIKHERKLF